MRDGDPEFPSFVGAGADEDLLWSIFSASRNPMLLADDGRNYVNANRAACQLLGYALAEIRTMRVDDITLPEYRPFLDAVWDDFLQRGGTVGHFAVVRADGSQVDVEFNATANVAPGLHLSIFLNPEEVGEGGALDDAGSPADKNLEEPVSAIAAAPGILDGVERQAMTLLALGLNWHEVADETGLSVAEAGAVMTSAMEKLGARTRAHAVSIAIRAGEIDPA